MSCRHGALFPREPVYSMGEADLRGAKMGMRVLVIDDEPSVRLLLTYALRDTGAEVHVAASGAEGLALFEKHHFDVVYVDLQLPDLGGDDIVHRMRKVRADTAIVMMTAEPEHLVPARKHVDAYLNKPFRLATLEQTLRAAVSARAQLTV